MPRTPQSPGPAHDPRRQQLLAVRHALLRLHKALLDAERAELEREQPALTPGQLLQAVIHDPRFAWLRPASSLVVQIDETLSPRKPPLAPETARALVEEARALLVPSDLGAGFAVRAAAIRRHSRPADEAFAELARVLAGVGQG
jgi:hypothetical protein